MQTTVDHKLKVGDKVYHKKTPKSIAISIDIDLSKSSHKGGTVQIRIIQDSYHPTDHIAYWYYQNCILVKEKGATQDDNLCSCPIETLMSKGCKCNGC